MELRCWLEHGNITKQIQFKYKRNLKEIHVFAARTYTQTQAQSCKQEMKKELYPFSSSCVCARVYISYVYLYATTLLKRKSPLQVRFAMNWGACGVDVSVCIFHFFFFCFLSCRDPLPGKGWWVSRSRNWTRNIWIPWSVPSTISLAGTVAKLEVFPTRKHFKSTF